MAVEIRTVDPDELAQWLRSMRVGFHSPEPSADEEDARAAQFAEEVDFARIHGAFADGRAVATFRSFTTQLTVPGGFVAADAITNVTVAPTHRRQGLLSAMMRPDPAAAAERGEPVAILIASEWPIYGRYGFGPAAEEAEYEIDARGARFAVAGEGEVTLVDAHQMRAAAPAVYEEHRRTTPGAIERSDGWWNRRVGLSQAGWPTFEDTPRFALVHDDGGAPAGLLIYGVESHWDNWRPRGTLSIGELFAATPAAEAGLWRFATEVDLVATVKAGERSVAELLPWLLVDGRAERQRSRSDNFWLRVLDVPAALAARRYGCEDALVLEVEDELGHAAGRFLLEGSPRDARCVPTDAPADLWLRAEALGAAYLGGVALSALAAAGWVREQRPGAVARAHALFGWPVPPWCATLF